MSLRSRLPDHHALHIGVMQKDEKGSGFPIR